jgi:hypothetical protein
MHAPLTAVREHSQRLLAAILSEQDHALEGLLATREELLRQLRSAIAAGEAMAPAEVLAVEELEQAIRTALQERRDAVGGEIAALRHGQDAEAAYGAVDVRPARYLDRAG